ncbi:hypothetical protein [Pinibacter soli]|uniref:Outer membrane protein beta-barrel domain-containing protein n=1 Tax=Pinibacter soli TaxID=3044211 RepID=A0ABT6R6Y0_9BACT|nr:hypothetical protein [Pinibacter soli]MDI3318305.1 hypothetical protein [Pinibacter soli]
MKKLLLTAFVAVIVFTAKSQPGSILLFGGLNFYSTNDKNTDTKTSSVIFTPAVGYQFNKNMTTGLEFGVGAGKSETPSFKVGPFLRYAWPISNIFAIYTQLGLGYFHQGEAYLNSNIDYTNVSGMYIGLSGPTVFINVKNSFGINFGFGSIDFMSGKVKDKDNVSSFALNFGNNISLGLSKNFGGKK